MQREVGSIIKQFRESCKMTQTVLANELDPSKSIISAKEYLYISTIHDIQE